MEHLKITKLALLSALCLNLVAWSSQARAELLGGPNLVINGDFEAGNTGFSTDYRFSPGSIFDFHEYAITTNPRLVHNFATAYGDHTSGSGLMMAVNGPLSSSNLTVWAQTVAVELNTIYTFAAWVSSWSSAPPELNALLDFSINGTSLGTFRAPSPAGVWERFSASWDSDSNTAASIRIVVLNPGEFIANDFALDDISLSTAAPAEVIPEPSTLTLLGIGTFGLLGYGWRRGRRNHATIGGSP